MGELFFYSIIPPGRDTPENSLIRSRREFEVREDDKGDYGVLISSGHGGLIPDKLGEGIMLEAGERFSIKKSSKKGSGLSGKDLKQTGKKNNITDNKDCLFLFGKFYLKDKKKLK